MCNTGEFGVQIFARLISQTTQRNGTDTDTRCLTFSFSLFFLVLPTFCSMNSVFFCCWKEFKFATIPLWFFHRTTTTQQWKKKHFWCFSWSSLIKSVKVSYKNKRKKKKKWKRLIFWKNSNGKNRHHDQPKEQEIERAFCQHNDLANRGSLIVCVLAFCSKCFFAA